MEKIRFELRSKSPFKMHPRMPAEDTRKNVFSNLDRDAAYNYRAEKPIPSKPYYRDLLKKIMKIEKND